MKRIIITIIAITTILTANAQDGGGVVGTDIINIHKEVKVRKDTVTKVITIIPPTKHVTYISAGVGMDSPRGKSDYPGLKSGFGYTLLVGHQFPLGKSRCYYTIEGGLSSRNLDEIVVTHGFMLSPVNLGWRPIIGEKLELDFSMGLYASYDLFGNTDYSDRFSWDDLVSNKYDYGLQFNAGLWFTKHLYGGFKYTHGMATWVAHYISGKEDMPLSKYELCFRCGF